MRITCLLLLATAVLGQSAENTAAEDKAVERIMATELYEAMKRHPTWATSRGVHDFDTKLATAAPKARMFSRDFAFRHNQKLAKLDHAKLSPANRVNAFLLRHECEKRIQDAKFFPHQTSITQMWGVQRGLPQLPSKITFNSRKRYDDYLMRLAAVSGLIDQTIVNLREGLAAGRTPSRVVVAPAIAQARHHGGEKFTANPELHAMWPPFTKKQEPWVDQARAKELITTQVAPAFTRLADFLENEYLPKCRESIGASEGIDGLPYYEWQLRKHTTLPLTADEIHATGLAEVKRIRGEMKALMQKHDLPHKDDFARFANFLRTDPRFFFTDKNDLLAGYRDIAKRIDANMPLLFGRLPRLPYGVKEMPGFIAAASPTAYYYSGSLKTGKPGYFVANTFNLAQRPKYEMVALTLHEAVPGHHHQIALAQEATGIHEWRTTLSYTAFGEGWALYAERLGMEMRDIYRTPYDHFGRLSYEMWRAMRLVVDTGIHAKKWTRQRAIDYMLANSALTEVNVAREVDRYIAWPGQATAYKIGELWIRRLRTEAERDLGDKFDLRSFHDTILEAGSVPLGLLEQRIRAWVEARR